jgi:hypothetical protein
MAHFPAEYPSLFVHLADISQQPILSSSDTETATFSQAPAVARPPRHLVESSAASCYNSCALGIGRPAHVLIETADGGPFLIHSYIKGIPARSLDANVDNSTDALGDQDRIGSRSRSPHAAPSLSKDGDHLSQTPRGATSRATTRSPHRDLSRDRNSDYADAASSIDADVETLADAEADENEQNQHMLVASVAAPDITHYNEARRALQGLVTIGREFLVEWQKREDEWGENASRRDQSEESG